MAYATDQLRWWDLDATDLDGSLHSILAPIQLGSEDYGADWDRFARENPRGAYAWLVGVQLRQLEDAIVALRVIQKLVASPRLPIGTGLGNITRDEWLRMTVDLYLFRTAGIRDHCAHLVNEVFELGLKANDVRVRKIVAIGSIAGTDVTDALVKVAAAAPQHRSERNRRAHEGFQRSLVGDDDLIFKIAAMDEELGATATRRMRIRRPGQSEEDYDLAGAFQKASDELGAEFIPAAEELVDATRELVDALDAPFLDRCRVKEFTANG